MTGQLTPPALIELFKLITWQVESSKKHIRWSKKQKIFFQAIASPAYIVASLENMNEVSADFFCPVKKCFEFACEASFKKSTIPEYKKEYQEIEDRLWLLNKF